MKRASVKLGSKSARRRRACALRKVKRVLKARVLERVQELESSFVRATVNSVVVDQRLDFAAGDWWS